MTTNYYWTQAEDDVLLRDHTIPEMLDLLPNRTRDAILNRKSLLKQKAKAGTIAMSRKLRGATAHSRPYTAADDAIMREYDDRPFGEIINELAERLDRSRDSIRHRLKRVREMDDGDNTTRKCGVREGASVMLQEWPDLGPNAFEDMKLKPDVRLNFRGTYYA